MSDTVTREAPNEALEAAEPIARIYGQLMEQLPLDLYIPPDAMAVMLDAFEGPLDLLLYLIRKANVNVLDIPMAPLTVQYLTYVEAMRSHNLELAADYLVMAAMLIEIKSRMLLPKARVVEGEDVEDPRAELVRRLIEYEQMKLAAYNLNAMPQAERDFDWVEVWVEKSMLQRLPDGAAVLWLSKGFEAGSGRLGHEIAREAAPGLRAGVLSGPSFALEVARGQPTALVAASQDAALCQSA